MAAPLVAVLDYGIGNLRSAQKALERVGADARLTADPAVAARAAAVVLPGVGAFGRCAEALRATGLDAVARSAVEAGTPFLGICVGLQLLYEGSDEAPAVPGLGVLRGTVRRLPDGVKRPQMQWNRLDRAGAGPSGLLAGLDERPWVYFVHSYAPAPEAGGGVAGGGVAGGVVATCDYGGPVVAAVERGPVWATQFHPEKSGRTGLAILGNFVRLAAAAA